MSGEQIGPRFGRREEAQRVLEFFQDPAIIRHIPIEREGSEAEAQAHEEPQETQIQETTDSTATDLSSL